jgi:hypothetical protein
LESESSKNHRLGLTDDLEREGADLMVGASAPHELIHVPNRLSESSTDDMPEANAGDVQQEWVTINVVQPSSSETNEGT